MSVPYQRLDTAKSEIRLLTIQPGEWDDLIRCGLHIASFDNKPIYEAISYAWGGYDGEPAETAGIVIDGVHITVTVNLQRALRRFRYAEKDRVMWADAVCINQEDVFERSQQVAIMADIFSSCTRCMIWLGEEEEFPLAPYSLADKWRRPDDVAALERYIESQGKTHITPVPNYVPLQFDDHCGNWLDVRAAFDLAVMIANGKHFYEMPFYRITEFPKFEFCIQWENAWHSLANIIGERPWWKRTWTVQEAILPDVAIIQLGNHQLQFATLLCAGTNFDDHDADCCHGSYRGLWKMYSVVKGKTNLTTALDLVNGLNHTRFLRREGNPQSLPSRLVSCQQLSQKRRTTDPRDSIYGLSGVFPDILGPHDGPNYTKDTATVYSEASLRMIQSFENLTTLQHSSPRRNREYLNLPSWVQDWGTVERVFPTRVHDARGNYTVYEPPESLLQSLALPLVSYKISTIQQIGRVLKKPVGVILANHNLVDTLLSWKGLTPVPDDTFWRTVFQDTQLTKGDEIPANSWMVEEDYEFVAGWWQRTQSMGPDKFDTEMEEGNIDQRTTQVWRELNYKCHTAAGGAVYFLSALGGPGTAQTGIEVGDEIHIAKGCPWPIVLRPLTTTTEGVPDEIRPDLYNILSCCYLDGFMDGEGVEGEVDWRTIYLR